MNKRKVYEYVEAESTGKMVEIVNEPVIVPGNFQHLNGGKAGFRRKHYYASMLIKWDNDIYDVKKLKYRLKDDLHFQKIAKKEPLFTNVLYLESPGIENNALKLRIIEDDPHTLSCYVMRTDTTTGLTLWYLRRKSSDFKKFFYNAILNLINKVPFKTLKKLKRMQHLLSKEEE